jgi:hypothetical protein
LSRDTTSFILGYHGCDKSVAQKAVLEGADILHSKRDFDWLGNGAYFWESDPQRALEWAEWKADRGDYREPTVIGAVIDLRNCLDLTTRSDIELLKQAYQNFVNLQRRSGLPLPTNQNPKGTKDKDRVLRFLDCAVIQHLHEIMDDLVKRNPNIEHYDTVRGMFVEGGKAFPGSGMYNKSHAQIAVRNPACIRGIFYAIKSN